ncbi:hypothetical protein HPB51_005461 [Rhipicephalus microplus]|uniref:DH domain-containing protein n=1 Tax=Rhipicephalus microplus TaxID=6941 RepID=A0A9J6EY56_RHIMP|nr:hypothetical protein HPB51_005461 [Rhipicephalus microplus]
MWFSSCWSSEDNVRMSCTASGTAPPQGVYSSSVESASFLSTGTPPARKKGSRDSEQDEAAQEVPPSEAEMLTMCKCIVSSIIESETAYVDCLDTLNQVIKLLQLATCKVLVHLSWL